MNAAQCAFKSVINVDHVTLTLKKMYIAMFLNILMLLPRLRSSDAAAEVWLPPLPVHAVPAASRNTSDAHRAGEVISW